MVFMTKKHIFLYSPLDSVTMLWYTAFVTLLRVMVFY